MNAIEINNLDFSYRAKESILQNINMHIPKGCIYGFLGSNGAGKTTTLKLILNLLKNKSQGEIQVMGKDVSNNYPNYLHHVGSLIEDASIYKHLNARKNLEIWRNYYNVEKTRIDEVLEIIGLPDTKKKTRDFSTGMKQRLGLGIAMIHNPDILILDEPTNGLDPMGINDLRLLLNRLRDNGKTILLSSHILSEVEKIVDQIGIIKNGSIAFEGTVDQLKSMAAEDAIVMVSVDNIEKASMLLSKKYEVTMIADYIQVSISSKEDINDIAKELINNGLHIYELNRPKNDLENVFMKLAK